MAIVHGKTWTRAALQGKVVLLDLIALDEGNQVKKTFQRASLPRTLGP